VANFASTPDGGLSLSWIPYFDERLLIHERQLEALHSRLSEHKAFLQETRSDLLAFCIELARKCESVTRDVQVVNAQASSSVMAKCEDLRSRIDREIVNENSYAGSELEMQFEDLWSRIDGEM
jgi:hypothetical protein